MVPVTAALVSIAFALVTAVATGALLRWMVMVSVPPFRHVPAISAYATLKIYLIADIDHRQAALVAST
jgi:hypothetical protein